MTHHDGGITDAMVKRLTDRMARALHEDREHVDNPYDGPGVPLDGSVCDCDLAAKVAMRAIEASLRDARQAAVNGLGAHIVSCDGADDCLNDVLAALDGKDDDG